MRVAVFSDIHGNLPAWRAALEQMRRWQADRHVFLGDLCGYYYQALEIFEELHRLPGMVAVRGNHDQMFLDIRGGDTALRQEYARRYGGAMEHLLDSDHEEMAHWLESLPLTATMENALCVHGSPSAPLEGYLYPDTEAVNLSAQGGEGTILLGHTHHRMDKVLGGQRLLNPGALGQPRDRLPACWVAWDTQRDEVRFVDVHFEVDTVIRQVLAQGGEPPYLIEVLRRIPEVL